MSCQPNKYDGPATRANYITDVHSTCILTHSPLELLPKNGFWSYSDSFLLTFWPKSTETCPNFAWKSGSKKSFVPGGKLQLRKFGHAQKTKFWVEKFPALASTFIFRSFSLPLLSFDGYLVSFSSVGNICTKSPRVVKLFLTKSGRVVEQNLHWNFWVKVTCFFVFLWTAWLNHADLGMVRNISPARMLDKLPDKVFLDH